MNFHSLFGEPVEDSPSHTVPATAESHLLKCVECLWERKVRVVDQSQDNTLFIKANSHLFALKI